MEEKKILITDFVKKYKTLTSEKLKSDYIASIMKCNYCPVLKKRYMLNLMLEKSIDEDNNRKTVDMFLNKLNFYATIISLYTYIVPEKDENSTPKSYEMYDLLIENNLMNPILELVGEREIGELTSINGLLLDNWYAKNNSTEAYVNGLVETASHKFGVTAGAAMDKLADVLADEKKMNKIMTALDKMMKKAK